jgi:hypothetical protein
MRMDRIKAQIPTLECSAVAELPSRTPSPEWDYAVSTAVSRLNEGWIMPDTRCRPTVEAEFAAFLSAYAMLPEEMDAAALARLGAA